MPTAIKKKPVAPKGGLKGIGGLAGRVAAQAGRGGLRTGAITSAACRRLASSAAFSTRSTTHSRSGREAIGRQLRPVVQENGRAREAEVVAQRAGQRPLTARRA